MFDSCVLGVDPGVATLGVAAVAREGRRSRVLWARNVRTSTASSEPERLRAISAAIRDAIAEHRPDAIALERVAWGKNKVSALAVARAIGVVMLAGAEAGLPVEEYGPLEVKMAVTGSGNAEKRQVRDALVRIHRVEDVPEQVDAADAVAVALCHLQQARIRRAARTASR